MIVTFRESDHTYWSADGRRVPDTHMVMEATGIRDVYTGDPIYGDRGWWVHAATELVDKQALDWDEARRDHPDWIGFVESYANRMAKEHIEIQHTEHIVASDEWWYAGTIDRVCLWDGVPTLVDMTTSSSDPAKIVQLALYDQAMGGAHHDHDLRVVWLQKNGKAARTPIVKLEVLTEARTAAHYAAWLYRWRHPPGKSFVRSGARIVGAPGGSEEGMSEHTPGLDIY